MALLRQMGIRKVPTKLVTSVLPLHILKDMPVESKRTYTVELFNYEGEGELYYFQATLMLQTKQQNGSTVSVATPPNGAIRLYCDGAVIAEKAGVINNGHLKFDILQKYGQEVFRGTIPSSGQTNLEKDNETPIISRGKIHFFKNMKVEIELTNANMDGTLLYSGISSLLRFEIEEGKWL